MSESDLVLFERRGSLAVLTLNRPERRNALSQPLIKSLGVNFERTRADGDVRCVILTGSGSSFCAGMDLAELQESLSPEKMQGENSVVWQDALRLAQLFDLIYTFPKPTIAAVNGAAVAGGAGLVTVCDLAVAVSSAKFGYPEVRRGLVAAMVMPHLLRHVGERMARYLFLTGEMIDARAAQEAGLINAVTPPEDLMTTAAQWAQFVEAGGPLAIARTKDLLDSFSHQALSVEQAAQESAAPRLTQECRDGLTAFFEKRLPPWLKTIK